LNGVPSAAGSGFVKGDPGELLRAAALVRPVQAQAGGLATGVAARGRQAAAAAGGAEVATAVSALAAALAQALGDTGTVLGHLGEVAELVAANLDQAGAP
jgi:hypothetical protein